MNTNTTEKGLEHIQKLDIRVARTPEDLFKCLSKITGSINAAKDVLANIFEQSNSNSGMNNYTTI